MSVLTLQQLKDMPSGHIIATGVTTDPRLYKDQVRWVAKRGIIHDWAIYYHHAWHSSDFVMRHGDKCFTEAVIKELVPCDDSAYSMYRF